MALGLDNLRSKILGSAAKSVPIALFRIEEEEMGRGGAGGGLIRLP
jgi:hypothetical protein